MAGKVGPEIIRSRSARLRAVGIQKNDEFQAGLAGREFEALVLHQRADDGRLVALTGNYLEVLVGQPVPLAAPAAPDTLGNRFVTVRLSERRPDGRWEADVEHVEEWDGPDPIGVAAPDAVGITAPDAVGCRGVA